MSYCAECVLLVVESKTCHDSHHYWTSQTTYSYRQIRKIDTARFCNDILCSKLYTCTTTDADEYADLFNEEVRRVLDSHAPVRTRRRRLGQHDIRQLSDDAKHAKQVRRRLERQYRRTGSEADLTELTDLPAWRLAPAFRNHKLTSSRKSSTLCLAT